MDMMVTVSTSLNLLVQVLEYLGLDAPKKRQVNEFTMEAYIDRELYKSYKKRYQSIYRDLYFNKGAICWQEHQFLREFELISRKKELLEFEADDWDTWQDICYQGDI